MLFNSIEFIVFLPVVFIVYWKLFSRSGAQQNFFLLVASLFFYGWADWRFLFLIVSSIGLNYFIGKQIADSNSEKTKHSLLWLAVAVNFGILGYFKYFNFFYESFAHLFSVFGAHITYSPLKILLPLGISFFTFQTVGYIIDVYNEKMEPCRDLLTFSTYVAFFPKLLAGPIERAQNFIPQLDKKRVFNYELATDGCKQMLWGAFAKLAIADNCADFVNPIFNNFHHETGGTLLLAAVLYLIQVYGDFSGYSNMASGISKLLGLKLTKNFATPFFSVSISDFWRKWHISLTSWMMDYLFTPLSFILRRLPKAGLVISISITFITVGFWHGANWTFLAFGILQSIYFLPLALSGNINKPSMNNAAGSSSSIKTVFRMVCMFMLMAVTFVLLRADTLSQAIAIYQKIFSLSLLKLPAVALVKKLFYLLILIVFFILQEWKTRNSEHTLQTVFAQRPTLWRWSYYSFIILLLCLFMATSETPFIYFQF